jgi:hypothetical protein
MSWINGDKERDQRRMMPAPHIDIDSSVCRPPEFSQTGTNHSAVSKLVVGQAISVVTIMYLYKSG